MIRFALHRLRTSILLGLIISLFFSFGISIAYAGDTQPPTFNSISVLPASGSPGDTLKVSVSATDNVALEGGVVEYESPNGSLWYVELVYDTSSGNLVGDFKIDQYDIAGVWKVTYIDIWDTSDNSFYATEDEVDLSGGNVTVINQHGDVTPPTFKSIQLSNTQTNPGGKLQVTIDASDSESGLYYAEVVWLKGSEFIFTYLTYNGETKKLEGDLYIPVKQPADTYKLEGISVYDHQFNEYSWDAVSGPAITGKDLVLINDPEAPVAGFSDVRAGDWFAEDVLFLVELAVIGGYSDGTFRPSLNVTRAEFAKMICLASDWDLVEPSNPSFGDVPAGNWAYKYIETAKAHGVINGYPGGVFKPNDKITRAEICKMLVAAGSIELDTTGVSFGDVPSDHWARQYIMTARNYEFVSGYAGNIFKPSALATRAEAARMIGNSYEYLGL